MVGEGEKYGKFAWLCKCRCGSTAVQTSHALTSGSAKSCGCWTVEYHSKVSNTATHRKSKSRVYRVWATMRSRCTNPRVPAYKYYGGRGIRCCKRWGKFENFYADMGDPPEGMTLERINNDRDYSPRNCRWATAEEQASNKRSTRRFTFRGETKTAVEWAVITGLNRKTILCRVDTYGWSVDKALTVRRRGRKKSKRPPEFTTLGHVHREKSA